MKALGAVVSVGGGAAGLRRRSGRADREEKRAALDKWTRTADAACEKANTSIAKRGWPVNLVDLDRLTVRAITDIQAASKTIRAQKPPAGSEDKVQPFVQSLEELDDDDEAALGRHRGASRIAKPRTSSCRSSAAACRRSRPPRRSSGCATAPPTQRARLHARRARRGAGAGLRPAARGPRPQADQARPSGSTATPRPPQRRRADPARAQRHRRHLRAPARRPQAALLGAQGVRQLRRGAARCLGRVLDKGAKALSSPPITPAEAAGLRPEARSAPAGPSARRSRSCSRASARSRPRPARGGDDEEPAGDDSEAA